MCRHFVNWYWVHKWNYDFLRIELGFLPKGRRETHGWCVQTHLKETFLDRFSWPVSTPVHHLFYTKSSLQGVVAVSFVPFWGGEGGCEEANNSGLNSLSLWFSALASEYEIASKSPSSELGRVSVTVIPLWQHSESKLDLLYSRHLSLFFSHLMGTF